METNTVETVVTPRTIEQATTHDITEINALREERIQLVEKTQRLQNESDDIRNQIDGAELRCRRTGRRVDAEWLERAQSARRIKLSQVRTLQARLTEINKVLKAANVADEPVAGVWDRRLQAALAVCKEALVYYQDNDEPHPLSEAIEDLEDAFPDWEKAVRPIDVSGN